MKQQPITTNNKTMTEQEKALVMEAFQFLYYRYTFVDGDDPNLLYEVHPDFDHELQVFLSNRKMKQQAKPNST